MYARQGLFQKAVAAWEEKASYPFTPLEGAWLYHEVCFVFLICNLVTMLLMMMIMDMIAIGMLTSAHFAVVADWPQLS